VASENDTHNTLRGVAQHDPTILEGLFMARLSNLEQSGLDERTYSLVNLAALIAQDAAPASYVWQVGLALDAGVSPEEILGLLVALSPTVGNARIVAAAPELALALGIDLDLLEEDGD
jgi:alkylhydroperoxidase/carboxymuconolactone decarboxylase family protein YurZ